mmetsp:Transcript_26538/g.66530  ORF Transcript_26538/g.66530 Transcript_26538/m.66530 type:complete len:156 (+) Transcript_26538:359-826(+)|eukprot:CAMPEP_0184733960 /NCGR_PEP_ID=MMETSP0314-20130426/59023_1 /TAXON_ID=38298 /ORGANISM="Rhodella maculata, Strain CCMP 736" /LENGTH=155 /DNA_ID=CAMNT_0027200851 /DNA_START=214 /DNA_END=681 /DNA_ORIENTATION=-
MTTPPSTHYVFVYGTLMHTFPNHFHVDSADYLGDFQTFDPYPLVVGGPFFSPYLLDRVGDGFRVTGELYAVDDATLSDLDALENVGKNYDKRRVAVRRVRAAEGAGEKAPEEVQAFVYLKCNYGKELMEAPRMRKYTDRRYIPRDRRGAATARAG